MLTAAAIAIALVGAAIAAFFGGVGLSLLVRSPRDYPRLYGVKRGPVDD